MNTENNKNQNQSDKSSERRGMLKGCGGCLISLILLIILISSCSMLIGNNDDSSSNKSSKTETSSKDKIRKKINQNLIKILTKTNKKQIQR